MEKSFHYYLKIDIKVQTLGKFDLNFNMIQEIFIKEMFVEIILFHFKAIVK